MSLSKHKSQKNDQLFSSTGKISVTILASEWGTSKGGLSTLNRELAIQLAKFPEVDVSFFVPQCGVEEKRAALSHNIEIVQATKRPGYDELEWLSFPPAQLQIDVVVGHGVKLGHQAQVIRESHKCKWIQVVHTDPEELGMFKTYQNPISTGEKKRQAEVELCEMADLIVGVGPKLCEAFRRYLHWCKKDKSILDITPGVFDEFENIEPLDEDMKRCGILVFGRGDAEDFKLKGFDIAAKAVAKVEDARLIFVGAPEGKHEEIAKRFRECGVPADRLTVRSFVKNRESLKHLFCEVDLALMPSRTEGFGLTGLEALSAGLPVLVSKNSGFGEALNEVLFGAAYVIDSEDSKVWAEEIKKVRKKKRQTQLQEADALRSSYGKKYSWAEQIQAFVTEMINIVNDASVCEVSGTQHQHQSSGLSLPQVAQKDDDQHTATNIFNDLQQLNSKQPTHKESELLLELQKTAEDKGFVICDNPASGNCMFYTLSEQLQHVKGINISHKEIRKELVRFLENFPNLPDGTELFKFVHGYPSWSDYLRIMAQDGTWGDHVILHTAANCYKTRIRVISSLGCDVMISPNHPDVVNTNTLVVGHIHEKHYVSLRLKQDITEPCELIERIRQLYKIREERLLPVPWCEDFSFKLSEIFTRLRIVRKDKTRGEMKEEITNMTAIFKTHEECEGKKTAPPTAPRTAPLTVPRTVLIEGDPGMGKTTYCQKLAYDWATSREHWDKSFPMIALLLLLRCHEIKSNLWQAIDEQLLPDDIDEESKQNLFKFIRENQSRVLFVFDGLDEADLGKIDLFISLTQRKVLPKCLFVFTSRHESGMKMRRYCDNLWEIVGFTQEDAEHFIYKYFRNMEHLAERLFKEIRSRSYLRQLTSNPLNTALLCILCEDFKEAFPESRTQLYIEIVKCVLRRYEEKEGFSRNNEDLIEVYEEKLRSLGRIALQSLLKGELYIEESKVNANNINAVKKFGFLSVQSGSRKRDPCFRYSFLHKSFQEFFAGFHLALKIVREEDEAEITILDKRFLGELHQVFLYICGVVAMQSEETARRLLRKLTTHVNMLSAASHGVTRNIELAFCLIEECEKCKKSLQSQLLHEFGAHLQLKACTLRMIPRFDFFFESLKSNTFLTYLELRSPTSREVVNDPDTISSVHLTWVSIGVASLSQALLVNNTLTHLNLKCAMVRDSGVDSLSEALSVNTALTHLYLNRNMIGASGASFLSRALSVNTTLAHLNLGRNEIGASGAASLSQALSVNSSLVYLNLDRNFLGDSGAASLSQAFSVNTTLAQLNLGRNAIGASGAASLSQALSVNGSLVDLNLERNFLGDSGAASLSQALSVNSSLTDLNLRDNKIGGSGASFLSRALSVKTTLAHLNLGRNEIGASGAASLSQALSVNSSLVDLNLERNFLGDSGAASLSQAFSVNTTLAHLNLGRNEIGASGAASLSQALSVNSSLVDLNLERNFLGDSGAASLSQAFSVNTTSTRLNLCGNEIGGSGAASLSQALSVNSSLTDLNLRDNKIGHSGAASLSQALSVNSSLTDLNLRDNKIGHSGAASLSQALSVNSSLTDLNLRDNKIGDSGAACLSQALSVNSSLTDLNLRDNKIGDSGAACLSQALSVNSSLTDLNLCDNKIGHSGAASLSQALSVNSSLTDLNLCDNKIGDSGAASLSQALSVNSSLTDLNLHGNKIGESGAASLSQALSVNTALTNLNLDINWISASVAASLSQTLSVNSSSG
ncbi:protein NLRC5-like isoform X2 [Pocillopora verrucosa]|uniref:protein NLRC5-like isoform X2 n=1 Tax=Pocillopora verrucosa TaxID=203993 RepID=UPI00333EC865